MPKLPKRPDLPKPKMPKRSDLPTPKLPKMPKRSDLPTPKLPKLPDRSDLRAPKLPSRADLSLPKISRPDPSALPRWAVRPVVALTVRAPLNVPVPISVSRAATDMLGRIALSAADGVTIDDYELGGLATRRLKPKGAPADRAYLHFHGGGFERGSATTHAAGFSHCAKAAKITCHIPSYRLAPEDPHPAGLEDALTAYRALVDSGISPDRIAVGGDSAGAALALGLALRLGDAGEPMPALLVLISPWIDLSLSGESTKRNANRDAGVSPRWLRGAAARYAGDYDLMDPEVSPLFADLKGLPPLHIQEAEEDVLGDDASRLAERAAKAGVEVDHRRYPDWHGFQVLAGIYKPAASALSDAAGAIKSVIARADVAPAPAPKPAKKSRRKTKVAKPKSKAKGKSKTTASKAKSKAAPKAKTPAKAKTASNASTAPKTKAKAAPKRKTAAKAKAKPAAKRKSAAKGKAAPKRKS